MNPKNLKNELKEFHHIFGDSRQPLQKYYQKPPPQKKVQYEKYEYVEQQYQQENNVLQDFILGTALNPEINDQQRKRQSRLDNIKEPQINILQQNRIPCKNNDLSNFTQITKQYPIKLKKEFSKQIQQLLLVQADVLIQCQQCNQILKAQTQQNKKNKTLGIKITHCGCIIEIQFHQEILNNDIIGYSSRNDIVFIEVLLDMMCNCGNIVDSIIFNEPICLESGKYILMANEYYRKLCRNCCKEIILQNCELFI